MVNNKLNPEVLNGKHIFIVEDNLSNRVIFQMILIKYGMNVTFERWGRDTLFRMNGLSHIDLVILDLMLPLGASGFDIHDEIRSVPKYAEVPIVAISAMDPSVAIPKAQAKGFNGFISKPIDNYQFPKQLEILLTGNQLWYAGERE